MAKKKKNTTTKVFNSAAIGGDLFQPAASAGNGKIWQWGADNLFPQRVSMLARSNAIHRGIISSKADYISGRGFAYDNNNIALERVVTRANGAQSLSQVIQQVVYDMVLTGNGFIEVAIAGNQMLFFHQDATRCRVVKPTEGADKRVIISADWHNHIEQYDVELPLFPTFEQDSEGVWRSVVHLKDYEPMFSHYGVPSYIAGLSAARIGYKTSSWNEQRLDNSFQLSGVMQVVAPEDDDEKLATLAHDIERKFAGKPGQVMFTVSNEVGSAQFTPIQSNNEGDWAALHGISKNDLVTAHSWFISLAGLDYTTGISSDRMLNEYSVALATIIQPEQAVVLEAIREALAMVGIDGSSLEFINMPPVIQKPVYMKIWEARKADGLDYDENDPAQQAFLANITKVGGNNE